ncbi:MAG: hypothetical protein ABWK01_01770 [Infirmifilum sp.]
MQSAPPPGFEPPLPSTLTLSPTLVSAAYRRSLRFGTFWRLKPEERAILLLARRLKAIRSPTLREAIINILAKVWPEKHRAIRAVEIGAKLLLHKVRLALKIGAAGVAQALLNSPHTLIPQLGLEYLNTPPLYRPRIEEVKWAA